MVKGLQLCMILDPIGLCSSGWTEGRSRNTEPSLCSAHHVLFIWCPRLTVVRRLCNIVADMHSKDIRHRDIKPSNIMLKNRGETSSMCLIDFGINFAEGDSTISIPNHPPRLGPTDALNRTFVYDIKCCACILLWFIDGRQTTSPSPSAKELKIESANFHPEHLYLISVIENALHTDDLYTYKTIQDFVAALEPKPDVELKLPVASTTCFETRT